MDDLSTSSTCRWPGCLNTLPHYAGTGTRRRLYCHEIVDGVLHDGQHAATHLSRSPQTREAMVLVGEGNPPRRIAVNARNLGGDFEPSAARRSAPWADVANGIITGSASDNRRSLTDQDHSAPDNSEHNGVASNRTGVASNHNGVAPDHSRGAAGPTQPDETQLPAFLSHFLAAQLTLALRRAEETTREADLARIDSTEAQALTLAQAERIGNADGRAEEALHQIELDRIELEKARRRIEALTERLGHAEGRAAEVARQLEYSKSEVANISAALVRAKEDGAAAWERCVLLVDRERALREQYNRLVGELLNLARRRENETLSPAAPAPHRSLRPRADRPAAN